MTPQIDDLSTQAVAAPAEAVAASDAIEPGVEAAPLEARHGKGGETVRVPAERLDALMDRVGELVIAQSRLKQVATGSIDQSQRRAPTRAGGLQRQQSCPGQLTTAGP